MSDSRAVWLTRDQLDGIWYGKAGTRQAILEAWYAAPADPHGSALSYLRNHADPRTDRDFVDTVLRALGMPA